MVLLISHKFNGQNPSLTGDSTGHLPVDIWLRQQVSPRDGGEGWSVEGRVMLIVLLTFRLAPTFLGQGRRETRTRQDDD